jgi:hypothetical protein
MFALGTQLSPEVAVAALGGYIAQHLHHPAPWSNTNYKGCRENMSLNSKSYGLQ